MWGPLWGEVLGPGSRCKIWRGPGGCGAHRCLAPPALPMHGRQLASCLLSGVVYPKSLASASWPLKWLHLERGLESGAYSLKVSQRSGLDQSNQCPCEAGSGPRVPVLWLLQVLAQPEEQNKAIWATSPRGPKSGWPPGSHLQELLCCPQSYSCGRVLPPEDARAAREQGWDLQPVQEGPDWPHVSHCPIQLHCPIQPGFHLAGGSEGPASGPHEARVHLVSRFQ